MKGDPDRRTGRTTRMLGSAIENALQGKEVTIYYMWGQEVDNFLALMWEIIERDETMGLGSLLVFERALMRVKIRNNQGVIKFRRIVWGSFDFRSMKEWGEVSDVTMVDHYTIDLIREQLHRGWLRDFVDWSEEMGYGKNVEE